jgi:hypothetical protein
MRAVDLHRTIERRHLDLPLRVERLEEDMDELEAGLGRVEKKLDSLNARATGLLISLVVAAIMLAVNLAVH